MSKCEHGLTSRECYVCASPKHGDAQQGEAEPLRLANAIDPMTRKSLDNLTCATAAAELRRLYWDELRVREHRDTLAAEITKLHAEVKALRGLINLKRAEWHDKHIWPCGGEAYQNWAITVYLPVPLSAVDKSPEAALARAIEEEEGGS